MRHGGWIIINDIINPRRAARERGKRKPGSIVDVNERPNTSAAANNWGAALANVVHHPAMLTYSRARTIEGSIAQDQPFQGGLGG